MLVLIATGFSITDAREWYINPDGTGDAPTIQAGIDLAAAGDSVVLAAGTYNQAGISFSGKPITVTSQGGPGVTIIDAGEGWRAFEFVSGEGPASVLSGVTVHSWHEAAYCYESSPTIINNVLGDNITVSAGVIGLFYSSAIVSNNVISNNYGTAVGGTISCSEGSPTITYNIFSSNRVQSDGAGISIWGTSAIISNNVFIGNDADGFGGGIWCSGGTPTISDNLFVENVGRAGGGAMFIANSAPTISGNTLSGNSTWGLAPESVCCGSAISVTDCSILVENTIISFHEGPDAIRCRTGASVNLSCCNVYGNAAGDWVGCIAGQEGIAGNFSTDPVFCDAANGDMTLNYFSPCLPGNHPNGDDCGLIGALGQGCRGVWTPAGRDVVVTPPDSASGDDPVTVTFDSVSVAGYVSLDILDQGPPPDHGFSLCGKYYDVVTTAAYTESVEVCIDYSETKCKKPRLQHYVGNRWVDVDPTYPGATDSILCGKVVSLSFFSLFEPLPSSVAFDIHPGSCPNPFNIKWLENIRNGNGNEMPKKGGVMPAAIVGSESFDVTDIDVSTLRLEGVEPLRSSLEDVTAPANGDGDCPCTAADPDGIIDLTLKFSRQEIAAAIGPRADGDVVTLTITGALLDGTPFEASDCVTIASKDPEQPEMAGSSEVELNPAVPNPFNPTTRISYWLPREASVRLSVYDVAGRLVDALVEGSQPRGEHVVEWNAGGLASGVYFCRLEVEGEVRVKRMVLLK